MSLFRSNRAVVATFTLALSVSATDTRAQTAFPANIHEAQNGTYALTYQFGNSTVPYANGDQLTVIINGTNDTLCVNGTLLTNPYLRDAAGEEKIFRDAASGIYYAISDELDGRFNEINVYYNSDSNWVGQFTGSRTGDSVTCGSGGSNNGGNTDTYTENGLTISTTIKSMFDLAVELYPGLFRTPSILREFDGYTYRYYRDSGTYIGFKDGKVYLMGGAFGNDITEYGVVDTVLSQLQALKDERLAQIPEGDFNLTISGQVITTQPIIGQISVAFGGITIAGIPAPGPNDLDEMTKVLVEQASLQNVRNVSVIQKENSANRVAFDLELTADLVTAGITTTSTYVLQYVYTK